MTIQVTRILVPLDHSRGSDGVVDYACVIARAMGATVTFMHVYEPPNEMVGIVPGASVAGEAEAERAAGGAVLDNALAMARANGVSTADRILERATPAYQAIVDHVARGTFDLIVMGTHGRSGVARWVKGSVAEQVLRHVTCPLLVVHLPGD